MTVVPRKESSEGAKGVLFGKHDTVKDRPPFHPLYPLPNSMIYDIYIIYTFCLLLKFWNNLAHSQLCQLLGILASATGQRQLWP